MLGETEPSEQPRDSRVMPRVQQRQGQAARAERLSVTPVPVWSSVHSVTVTPWGVLQEGLQKPTLPVESCLPSACSNTLAAAHSVKSADWRKCSEARTPLERLSFQTELINALS